MKKKILFIITKSNWGGAQKYVFDIITALQKNNKYDISLCVGGDGELITRLRAEGFQNIYNLKYMSNSMNPIKMLMSAVELSKIIYKSTPDIIHINSSFALLSSIKSIYITKIAKLLSITKYKPRIIFTAHGWPFSENRNILSKILLKIIMNICMLFVDKIITVSENIRSGIWIILKKKCYTIYNGIAFNNLDLQNIIDEKHQDKINILSIGELHPIKGHDLALLSLKEILLEMKTLPTDIPIHYHIFGEGHYREWLEKRIIELGLSNIVTLYGNVNNASAYIKYFDIFFMPSRSEGLAFALLEGYASGIEIISSDAGGLPEIVTNASHGELANVFNPFDLREKLKNKINNIYFAKSQQIYKRPEPEIVFSIENMIKETEKLYQ